MVSSALRQLRFHELVGAGTPLPPSWRAGWRQLRVQRSKTGAKIRRGAGGDRESLVARLFDAGGSTMRSTLT